MTIKKLVENHGNRWQPAILAQSRDASNVELQLSPKRIYGCLKDACF